MQRYGLFSLFPNFRTDNFISSSIHDDMGYVFSNVKKTTIRVTTRYKKIPTTLLRLGVIFHHPSSIFLRPFGSKRPSAERHHPSSIFLLPSSIFRQVPVPAVSRQVPVPAVSCLPPKERILLKRLDGLFVFLYPIGTTLLLHIE